MKKSIVLLISLFFITAISALIIKNLDDTNDYISLQNNKIDKIQLITLIKNAQKQIGAVISQNSDDMDKFMENQLGEFFPLQIEDINMKFKIQNYNRVDINDLTKKEEKDRKEIEDFFDNNGIYSRDSLRYLIKDNQINSTKQLDDIIFLYQKDNYDEKILQVKDLIGFLKNSEKNLYELFIKIEYLQNFMEAYYVLNKQGGVEYFEFSFK